MKDSRTSGADILWGRAGILLLLAWANVLVWSGCSSPQSSAVDRLFTYNASDGVRSLDPGKATDLEAMWVVDQLYEGLLELDAGLRIQPALAEAWSVSQDGRTYRFRLRAGVTFHNGAPVTARDVAASFSRLADPDEALPGRWVLSDLRADGGVEILRPDSFLLHLANPNPVFPGLLATPQAAILQGGGQDGDPNTADFGSGPFTLKGWIPETAMVLHRFAGYWMRDGAGERLPYIAGIRIEFNREPGAEFLGFSQGRYDFVSGLDPAWTQAFRDDAGVWAPAWAGRIQDYRVPYLKTDYIGVLMDSLALVEGGFPTLERPVRRAMSMALDRASLVRELRAGEAMPAQGFVPPGMPGFTPDMRPPHPDLTWSPDTARALLAAAGIGAEAPLRRLRGVVLGTKPEMADLAAALQHIWAGYGIDVDIDIAPSGIDAERVAKSQVPLFRKSWLADYPDAENFLGLFLPDRWCPNGPNYTHFEEQTVTDLLLGAADMVPGEQREAVLRRAEQGVLEEMPVIPLWHDEVVHWVSARWAGWQVSPTNRLDLRRIRPRDE